MNLHEKINSKAFRQKAINFHLNKNTPTIWDNIGFKLNLKLFNNLIKVKTQKK